MAGAYFILSSTKFLIDALWSRLRNERGVTQGLPWRPRHLGRPPSFVAKVELLESRRLDVTEFVHWAEALSIDPLGSIYQKYASLFH